MVQAPLEATGGGDVVGGVVVLPPPQAAVRSANAITTRIPEIIRAADRSLPRL